MGIFLKISSLRKRFQKSRLRNSVREVAAKAVQRLRRYGFAALSPRQRELEERDVADYYQEAALFVVSDAAMRALERTRRRCLVPVLVVGAYRHLLKVLGRRLRDRRRYPTNRGDVLDRSSVGGGYEAVDLRLDLDALSDDHRRYIDYRVAGDTVPTIRRETGWSMRYLSHVRAEVRRTLREMADGV